MASDPAGSKISARRARRARRLARTALAFGLVAVGLLTVATSLGGAVTTAVIAVAALALAAAGGWWALAHRGVARAAGLLVTIGALVAMIVLYAGSTIRWLVAFGAALAWAGGLVLSRAALRADGAEQGPRVRETPPPRHPVLIMNPASGGGKVGRFGLVERAERLGCRVVLMDPAHHQDVAETARQALADGADLLGVAGGDGTQALVAGVAAEHDVPFLVISAGTHNHFAMDLGLDRDDPSQCLRALTDGVELRVDLGRVAGRTFVNNASFGVYAEIVQRPEYRDAKAATMLRELPDLLTGYSGARLTAHADGRVLTGPQALLVSCDPYDTGWYGSGRRPRLDTGMLGVIALKVRSPVQAADLAVRGEQSAALTAMTAREVVVTADTGTVDAGVDGEALVLPVPVRCVIVPGALRVRVPRERPGSRPARQAVDWRRLGELVRARPGNAG
ncbi:MAG: diacylglycerol kinase [Catenulispora sp.]|nr:diacylglycerol kinase [Catenulispora sp.]